DTGAERKKPRNSTLPRPDRRLSRRVGSALRVHGRPPPEVKASFARFETRPVSQQLKQFLGVNATPAEVSSASIRKAAGIQNGSIQRCHFPSRRCIFLCSFSHSRN